MPRQEPRWSCTNRAPFIDSIAAQTTTPVIVVYVFGLPLTALDILSVLPYGG